MIWRTPKYTGPERRKRPRWRPRPFRVLLILLGVAAVAYLFAAFWLIAQETRLVFQAVQTLGDARPPFPYEQIDLPRDDSARQFAWVMPQPDADAAPWVVYLHGTPSTIASPVNISHYRMLRDVDLNVLAPEYRGVGGLDGRLTEASLLADARTGYEYLSGVRGVDPGRIVLYGWSRGASVAIDLATRVPVAAVIVEGTPASVADHVQRQYPFIPVRLLMGRPFESVRHVAGVNVPMLFLHGPDDEVVPIEDGRRVYEAARGEKMFVEVRGGHVEAIDRDEDRFLTTIRAFLRQHDVLAR